MSVQRCVARRAARSLVLLALGIIFAVACSDEAPPNITAPIWPCPPAWVRAAVEGCGPAVLLCVPDGGAAPHACDGVDITRPPTLALPDGGTVRGFYRLPDGGIGGGWPEPGDPDGPPDEDWVPDVGSGVPAEDWQPDAGIATCPAGWQRRADRTCDPRLRDDCPVGSGALPGGVCTPTSPVDCPAGEYADPGVEAMGAAVVHVRAGADATGADGSVARPYPTISEGVRHAGDGGWALVAAGEYREQLGMTGRESTHVLGVCAARVILRGPGPVGPVGATVRVRGSGADLDLRGLTITGAGWGIGVETGGRAHITAVIVTDTTAGGVVAFSGGTIEIRGSVVRRTTPGPDPRVGYGLVAESGATLNATGVFVDANAITGIRAYHNGTRARVLGSVVRGTRSVRGDSGVGVIAYDGASLYTAGVVVENNQRYGVRVNDNETSVEMVSSVVRGTVLGDGVAVTGGARFDAEHVLVSDNGGREVVVSGRSTDVEVRACVVRETGPLTDRAEWGGLVASDGARLRATGSLVLDVGVAGVIADGPETVVDVTETIVRGTRLDPHNAGGLGMTARRGATLRATSVLVADNARVGVIAKGEGTHGEVTASIVRGTRGGVQEYSRGVEGNSGAALRMEHVLVADNVGEGVAVGEAGSTADLVACVIRDTEPYSDGSNGRGIYAGEGARLRVAGTLVENNHEAGIAAEAPATAVDVTTSVVRGTRTRPDGRGGRGLTACRGARLRATATVMRDNHELGVAAYDRETLVELDGSIVRDTRPREGGSMGYGIQASRGAAVRATSVVAAGNSEVGIAVFNAGTTVDLRGSVVRATRPLDGQIGRGVQVSDGASFRATRVVVEDSYDVGVFAFDEADVELTESVIRGTSPRKGGGAFGRAIEGARGGTLRFQSVLLLDNTEVGVSAVGVELHAVDLLVAGVSPSTRGFGVGLFVTGGAQADAVRVSLQALGGAGLMTNGYQSVVGARVVVHDLFVRDVRPDTVHFTETGTTDERVRSPVSHGLHAGRACTIDVTRAVLDDCGLGFFNASGVVRIHQGVIAHQREGVGTFDRATPEDATTLDRVCFVGNASNVTSQRDAVPEGSALPGLAPLELP